MDFEIFRLFDQSNFDAYDGGHDRYPAVLTAGLAQHGIDVGEVLAVTQDGSMWVICATGVFTGSLRGVLKKRIEIGPFIPYSSIDSIESQRSGPHTWKVVLGRTAPSSRRST